MLKFCLKFGMDGSISVLVVGFYEMGDIGLYLFILECYGSFLFYCIWYCFDYGYVMQVFCLGVFMCVGCVGYI